ncbi:MAG TPA: fasciclin domain-containing protein [Gemmatimonadales bacterium]
MRKALAVMALLAPITLAACDDTSTEPQLQTIAELAQQTPALSTLLTAIGESDKSCGTNFAATLSGPGDFTVFAPTNDAFNAIIGALGAETVLSCAVLPTVLAFHVTQGRLDSKAVLGRSEIQMLSGERAAVSGTTIAGAPINLGLIDIRASNGIVHVVDAVLLPPSILTALSGGPLAARNEAARPDASTIVELAQATPFLSTLLFAVSESDTKCGTSFGATLSGKQGQYTVFAPTDDAFTALIGQLGQATVLSCDVLPTVLAYHVTTGRQTSVSVLGKKQIRMLSGEFAEVSGTTVGGAPLNLGYVDISAANGVVHVVDAVLLPPSLRP